MADYLRRTRRVKCDETKAQCLKASNTAGTAPATRPHSLLSIEPSQNPNTFARQNTTLNLQIPLLQPFPQILLLAGNQSTNASNTEMSGKGASPADVADEAVCHCVEYRDGLYSIEVA